MLNLVPKHDLFHTVCVLPEVQFENQKDTEKVFLTLRAHIITLVVPLFNIVLLIILTSLLPLILGNFISSSQLFYIIFFSSYVIFFYFWFTIVNWYFNIGIITNEQIIDVDFSALTFRNITRTEIPHIEDISVKLAGFISSIFDYGNIFVQTAGTEVNTEFIDVPHPTESAHIIQDILKEYGHAL